MTIAWHERSINFLKLCDIWKLSSTRLVFYGYLDSLLFAANASLNSQIHMFFSLNFSLTWSMQVHPYTFRNENQFLHLNFNEDPYLEFNYWLNHIGVDGIFTDFTGSLHNFQEWTSSQDRDTKSASKILHEITSLISSYNNGVWDQPLPRLICLFLFLMHNSIEIRT